MGIMDAINTIEKAHEHSSEGKLKRIYKLEDDVKKWVAPYIHDELKSEFQGIVNEIRTQGETSSEEITAALKPVLNRMEEVLRKIRSEAKGGLSDLEYRGFFDAIKENASELRNAYAKDLWKELGNEEGEKTIFKFVNQPVMRYDPKEPHSGPKDEDFKSSQRNEALDTLRDGNATLIIAKAGVGKSVFLRKLVMDIHDTGLIPVFCKCSHLRKPSDVLTIIISSAAVTSLGTKLRLGKKLALANKLLSENRIVFIFDGMDQMGSVDGTKTFQDLVLNPDRPVLGGCPIVVSSRTENVSFDHWHWQGCCVLKLEIFNHSNLREFYGDAYDELVEALDDKELRYVGFFARMLLWMHWHDGIHKGMSQSRIFQEYLKRFLDRATDEHKLVSPFELIGFQDALTDISLAGYQLDDPEILQIPSTIIQKYPHHSERLKQLEKVSILYKNPFGEVLCGDPLDDYNAPSYVFQHQIVQDYYAARGLAALRANESLDEFNTQLGQVGAFIKRMAEFLLENMEAKEVLSSRIHEQLLKDDEEGERGWRLTYLLYLRDNLIIRLGADEEMARIFQSEQKVAQTDQMEAFGRVPWETLKIGQVDEYRMMKIPPGRSLRGGWRGINEMPVRWVNISKPYLLCEFPVTRKFYSLIMGRYPSSINSSINNPNDNPIENISHMDALVFCNRLTEIVGEIDGEKQEIVYGNCNRNCFIKNKEANGYRLPTETEWEHACRAGTTCDFYGDLNEIAWHSENSAHRSHYPGMKCPNIFGLYDTLGNISELSEDPWHDNYQQNPINGQYLTQQSNKSFRAVRGGSWYDNPDDIRACCRRKCNRWRRYHDVGFRVCRNL